MKMSGSVDLNRPLSMKSEAGGWRASQKFFTIALFRRRQHQRQPRASQTAPTTALVPAQRQRQPSASASPAPAPALQPAHLAMHVHLAIQVDHILS